MTNRVALQLCRKWEGFRSSPYLCPAGVPTIGYGSTFYMDGTPVTMKDKPISEPRANLLLRRVIDRFELKTYALCPRLLTEHKERQGAVISWVYNFGPTKFSTSTFRKRLLEGAWEEAAREMKRWKFSRGKIERGLIRRRAEEAQFLLSSPSVFGW